MKTQELGENHSSMTPEIFFGHYRGLGDFISDAKIIGLFHERRYNITVSIAAWFAELAHMLFSNVRITPCNTWRDVVSQPYGHYDYIFMSPTYLSTNLKSIAAYAIKRAIIGCKSSNHGMVLAIESRTLLDGALETAPSLLNRHFFELSVDLLRTHVGILDGITNEDVDSLLIDRPASHCKKPTIREVFIFPFSGNQNKDYGLNNFLRLGRALETVAPHIPIRYFVSGNDFGQIDQPIRERYRFESRSLVELAKMFTKDVLVISNDSGPAHLASYYGANIITLFGPTSAERYHPIGRGCNVSITARSKVVKDIKIDQILQTVMNRYQEAVGPNQTDWGKQWEQAPPVGGRPWRPAVDHRDRSQPP